MPDAPRARLELEEEHEAHDARRERRADAGRMRAHDIDLQCREIGGAMRVVASLPKPVLTP